MTVYQFNNNINILDNKPYYESLKRVWKIILYHVIINTKTIKDNNDFCIKNILNSIFYSSYLTQLGITITKFEDNCIIIKYLEYELKLCIYPFDYDNTIRNLKFECAEYSFSEKIEKYLILFIDENWDLIIDFIEDNNCLKEDTIILLHQKDKYCKEYPRHSSISRHKPTIFDAIDELFTKQRKKEVTINVR